MKQTINIPKHIFENIFMKNGGQKDVTGETEQPLPEHQEHLANAEVEKNEYVLDSKGIRKFAGETHEKGGTLVKLEDGAKIGSDHLKIGAEHAKHFSSVLGCKIKAKDTYAKVLDKHGKISGIDEVNTKLEDLVSTLEKQEKEVKDKTTASFNTQFLIKQVQKETEKKQPLKKEREDLFNALFEVQENSKDQEKNQGNIMKNGGMINTLAKKYGISEERAMQLSGLPKYQIAGIFNEDGSLKLNSNTLPKVYPNQTTLVPTTTVNGNATQTNYNQAKENLFKREPSSYKFLPQTPIDVNKNVIFQGKNYEEQWMSLVKGSLADPKRAKEIESWLMNNTGDYAKNIRYQLNGLTGEAVTKKIWELATDRKPGPFHDAIQQAIKETAPPEPVVEATKPFTAGKEGETKMGMLSMPTRPVDMPTWTPSLKVSTRLNRIDPTLISPEQQLAETDRAIMGAQQDLSNLSPSQRAIANIGLTANQISSNSKAIQESNRFNAQAQGSANAYNAKIGDVEQQAENQNALSYEARTFKGLGAYENDYQNMLNQQFRDQIEKWRNVNMYNAQNAYNPDIQFDGNSYQIYKPSVESLTSNAIEKNLLFTEKEIEDRKKALSKKKATKKFGGRFKK